MCVGQRRNGDGDNKPTQMRPNGEDMMLISRQELVSLIGNAVLVEFQPILDSLKVVISRSESTLDRLDAILLKLQNLGSQMSNLGTNVDSLRAQLTAEIENTRCRCSPSSFCTSVPSSVTASQSQNMQLRPRKCVPNDSVRPRKSVREGRVRPRKRVPNDSVKPRQSARDGRAKPRKSIRNGSRRN